MPFDPFGDFHTAGYLRNIEAEKDIARVKIQEKLFFEVHLEDALDYLQRVAGPITYAHFRTVHEILFSEFYPWAGQDRQQLGVADRINKGRLVDFERADLIAQAIQWGLDMGNDIEKMREKPGAVMGAFAWAHPFLDGNGRAMMLVHAELCRRAGFMINWPATDKTAYLQTLTRELKEPRARPLDNYLRPFVQAANAGDDLATQLRRPPGLDGLALTNADDVAYDESDERAMASYHETKRSRGEFA